MKKTNRRSISTARSAHATTSSQSRRKLVVCTGLIGALTVTSALLLALAPAPLTPGATRSLFAIGSNESIDEIFETPVPIRPGRWKCIYVHHSQHLGGDAQTIAQAEGGLADHFVIGNGDGCVDGELQTGQRWAEQGPAGLTPGMEHIRPDCLSVCVVGDFNRARPTPTQERRLAQLVTVLQRRLGIRPQNVFVSQPGNGPAGVGTYFSVDALRAALLP